VNISHGWIVFLGLRVRRDLDKMEGAMFLTAALTMLILATATVFVDGAD
jgi:hypothetical protein